MFKERDRETTPFVERAEEIKLPETLRKETGAVPRPEHFTAQVEKRGQKLIQTPQTKTITIQLPADQTKLTAWAKGPIASSLTWLARFWLRIIKKAKHFGWQIIGGK